MNPRPKALAVDQALELDALLDELLHDLRTPATVLAGFAEEVGKSLARGETEDAAACAAVLGRKALELNDLLDRFVERRRALEGRTPA